MTTDLSQQLGGTPPALVLAFASTSQALEELTPELRKSFADAVVLGCSTAGEFTQNGDASGSVSAFALAGDFKVFAGLGTGLKANVEQAVSQATKDLPQSQSGYPHRSAVLLLDALAGNAEEAAMLTSSLMGGNIRLAGGAAGDDLKMSATHVCLGDQVAADAAAVAIIFSKAPLGVGVCHGHEPISDPVKVTKAEGGVVYEIDGRPAWDVWAEKTRDAAKKAGYDPDKLPTPQDVSDYLIRYEAGLATGKEYKIRVPLSRGEHGALNFACGVPEGSIIRITESVPERQIASAREATRRALAQTGNAPIAGALVFDCCCRKLILKEDFSKAVHAIHEELGHKPLAGFETYGEIAADAGDMSGFHNTTTVVMTFPE